MSKNIKKIVSYQGYDKGETRITHESYSGQPYFAGGYQCSMEERLEEGEESGDQWIKYYYINDNQEVSEEVYINYRKAYFTDNEEQYKMQKLSELSDVTDIIVYNDSKASHEQQSDKEENVNPDKSSESTEVPPQSDNQDSVSPPSASNTSNANTQKPSESMNNVTSGRNRTLRSTAKTVTIAWKKDQNAAAGYRIYVKSGKKYVKVGTTKAGTTRFTIKKIKGKSLKPGTIYTVRIASLKRVSGKLKEVKKITFKTATKPKTPIIISGKKKGSSKAVLKWKKIPGVSGYEIQMSTKAKKGFKKNCIGKVFKNNLYQREA